MIRWPIFGKSKKKEESSPDSISNFLTDTDFLPTEFHFSKEEPWCTTESRHEALSIIPQEPNTTNGYASQINGATAEDLRLHEQHKNDQVIPVLTEMLVPVDEAMGDGMDLDLAELEEEIPLLNEEVLNLDSLVEVDYHSVLAQTDVLLAEALEHLDEQMAVPANTAKDEDKTTLTINSTTEDGFVFGEITNDAQTRAAQAAALLSEDMEQQLTTLLDETINDVVTQVLQQQLRIATINLKVQIRDELMRRLRARASLNQAPTVAIKQADTDSNWPDRHTD